MNELVSIITPSYNCGTFIEATIRSVIAQTYQHWEMIIVDDCSTDDTQSVVRIAMANEPRIRYIINEHNCGAALSRNLALREAKGRWIAFLDSDDLWAAEKLQQQISFMETYGYAFSYHGYHEISEAGMPLGVRVGGKRRVSRWEMYACCWPGCLSVMYDREKIGLVQIADIRKNNDTALWLQVVTKAPCYYLPMDLAFYRRRQGSITPVGIWAKIRAHYPLFRVAQGMNPFAAWFWTFTNVFGNLYKKLFYIKRV